MQLGTSELLHNISLLIFAAIGTTVFSLSIGIFETEWKANSLIEVFGIIMFYCAFSFFLARCAHIHEKRIVEYFKTFRHLNNQEKQKRKENIEPVTDSKLTEREEEDRKNLTWRGWLISLYLIATFMTGIRFYEIVDSWAFMIFLLAQVVVVLIFIVQWHRYTRNLSFTGFKWGIKQKHSDTFKIDTFKIWNLIILVLFIFSVGVPFFCTSVRELPWLMPRTDLAVRMTELSGQLGKLETEIEEVNSSEKRQWVENFFPQKEASEIISTLNGLKERLNKIEQELEDTKKNPLAKKSEVMAVQQKLANLQRRLEVVETTSNNSPQN